MRVETVKHGGKNDKNKTECTYLIRLKNMAQNLGLATAAAKHIIWTGDESAPRHDDQNVPNVSNVGDGAQ